jgi:tetratricopeptide (TPR) repeat protein
VKHAPFLLFFFFLLFTRIVAENIDSLKSALKNVYSDRDTTKCTILALLTELTPEGEWQKYNDQLISLAQKNLEWSKNESVKIFYSRALGVALTNQALNYQQIGQVADAEDNLIKSLKILESINDQNNISITLNHLGSNYNRRHQYEKARDCFLRAMTICEKLNNKNRIILSLNHLGALYQIQGEASKAMECFEKVLRLGKELKNEKALAGVLYNIALLKHNQGEIGATIEYLEKAEAINKKNGDMISLSATLHMLGVVYLKKNDMTKALDYTYRALKTREHINDKLGISASLSNIASIYVALDDLEKAMEFYNKALKIQKETDNIAGVANSLANIGDIYGRKGNYVESIKYSEQALKIFREIDYKIGVSSTLDKIGIYSQKIGQNHRARECFIEALEISEKAGDKTGIAGRLINIGVIYSEEGNISKARIYFERSLALSRELGYPERIKSASENLYKIYKQNGNTAKALEMHELYLTMKDSLSNKETKTLALKKEFAYEIEKKENENILLAKQNEIQELQIEQHRYLMTGMAVIIVLGLTLVVVFVRQIRLRKSQREMQLEQKLLRSQMNPHFIFNSLQAIQNFILKNDQKEAVKYLGSFASITRTVLESSRFEKIPVKKEIALLENYLHLQKLRFGERFDYLIHVDPSIDVDNMDLPPMLSQPFIENALEHGMRDIESGGKIDIYFTVKDNNLLFEVVDNGKGIKTDDAETKQHQSMALAITKERIALMNKKARFKTIFSISEAFPLDPERKGVKVNFSIPL